MVVGNIAEIMTGIVLCPPYAVSWVLLYVRVFFFCGGGGGTLKIILANPRGGVIERLTLNCAINLSVLCSSW